MVVILSFICIVMCSLFYQLPSYNLFTQHVIYLYGETPLVHSFTPIKPPTANNCSLLLPTIKYYFSHHTFNPLLQQAGKIDNLPVSLGQSSLIVLCEGSTLVTEKRRHQQPSELLLLLLDLTTLVSYWGKTCCCTASYLPLGVSQRTCVSRHQAYFSGAVAGEIEDFGMGSLTLPISLLCFCLAYFILFYLVCF